MKVLFKLTHDEVISIACAMHAEHERYYALPHGARQNLGFTERKDYAGRTIEFCWTASSGNRLTVKWNWARYEGARNGLVRGGFLRECVPHLRDAQRRGDWRYISTQEPNWLPLETERDQ